MFILSWQITLVALCLLPVFLIPARMVGKRLGTLFQRGMELNAEMNMVMSERFNVAGAMVVKLFGRPGDELRHFEGSAGQVRDMGVHQATYQRFFFVALSLTASLATAFAYWFGGIAVIHAPPGPRHRRRADAVPDAPLRTAHPAVVDQHRLHVGHGELRAALRGARPRADDHRVARRARDPRRARRAALRPRGLLATREPRRSPWRP